MSELRIVCGLGLALVTNPVVVIGQADSLPSARPRAARPLVSAPVWFGVEGYWLVPVGEFRDHSPPGGGMNLFLAVYLGPRRAFGVRAAISESNQQDSRPLASPIGQLNVRNQYHILSATIGPQFTVPIGPLRVHGYGAIGFRRGETRADVQNLLNDSSLVLRTLRTSGLSYGGELGVMLPVATVHGWANDLPVAIQWSAAYVQGGSVQYFSPATTEVNPDRSVTASPQLSGAKFTVLRLGLSIGFP
jgi:hypothetical protein